MLEIRGSAYAALSDFFTEEIDVGLSRAGLRDSFLPPYLWSDVIHPTYRIPDSNHLIMGGDVASCREKLAEAEKSGAGARSLAGQLKSYGDSVMILLGLFWSDGRRFPQRDMVYAALLGRKPEEFYLEQGASFYWGAGTLEPDPSVSDLMMHLSTKFPLCVEGLRYVGEKMQTLNRPDVKNLAQELFG